MTKFQIPEKLLHQLNECAVGGFALFTFDTDGDPVIACQFDNQMTATAVQTMVGEWADSIRGLRNHQMTQNITR